MPRPSIFTVILLHCPLLLVCLFALSDGIARGQSDPPLLPKHLEHSFEEISAEFAKVQDTLSKSSKVTAQSGLIVLLDEWKVQYDERGAARISQRKIWKVTQREIGDLGIIEQEYSPWYQDQPTIRAVIFDPSGKRYELSSDDVSVSPAQTDDRTILSDNLIVRAALPGVKQGAIIEQVIETADKSPFFAAGTMQAFSTTFFSPQANLSIEIDSPSELALVFDYGNSENESRVVRTEQGERIVHKLVIPNPPSFVFDELESYVPLKQSQFQQFVVSTGKSWKDIASAYSQVVEGRMQSMDWESLVNEIAPEANATDRDRALACIRWIKENIRYTGVSLGEASIVPSRPLQVCTRRFGDCKDQATLLVGMLRQLKLEANVVLVNSYSYRMPIENIPCLNAFNHAIVRLKLDGKEYYVDTTHPGSTLRLVPDYLLGKHVLVVSPDTEKLSLIPIESNLENGSDESRSVRFNTDGTVRLETTITYRGHFASDAISTSVSMSNEEREKQVNEQYKASIPDATYRIIESFDPWTDAESFIEVAESNKLPLETVKPGVFRYDVLMRRMIQEIPYAQLVDFDDNNRVTNERKRDLEIRLPYTVSRATTFIRPDGYEVECEEGEMSKSFGPIRVSRKRSKNEDGSVTVSAKIEVGTGVMSPQEVTDLSAFAIAVAEPSHEFNSAVLIKTSGEGKNASPSLAKFHELRERWEASKSGDDLYEYVVGLMQLAQATEALRIAKDAVEHNPQDGSLFRALGVALMYDPVGREMFPGWDRDGAIAAFREAVRLQPDDWRNYYLLNTVLTSDVYGLKERNQGNIAEALSLSYNNPKLGKLDVRLARQLVLFLVSVDRFTEAIALAKEYRVRDAEWMAMCVKDAIESRWADVAAIRTQIGKDDAMILDVFQMATRDLLARGLYGLAEEFRSNYEGKTDEVQNRNRSTTRRHAFPGTTNENVLDVLHNYLNRISVVGDNTRQWSDLVYNPGDESPANKIFMVMTGPFREVIRPNEVTFARVNDLNYRRKVRVEGNDEIGYRCQFIEQTSNLIFYVVKENNQYKILLEGKNMEHLIVRAKPFLDNGEDEKALQILEWALSEYAPGQVLMPESGHPVKTLWSATKKKDAAFLRLMYNALKFCNYGYEECLADLRIAASEEKSKLKRIQLQRCILMGLHDHQYPEYEAEAATFIEDNQGFWSETSRLLFWYLTNGKTDKFDELLASVRDTMPESMIDHTEDKKLFSNREFRALYDKRYAKASQQSTLLELNSLLWAASFSNSVTKELFDAYPFQEKLQLIPDSLHTLALGYADCGMIEEAAGELRQLVAKRGEKIENVDWLIIASISEKCGLYDAARFGYEQVRDESKLPGSSYELAQLRLRELESASGAKKQ